MPAKVIGPSGRYIAMANRKYEKGHWVELPGLVATPTGPALCEEEDASPAVARTAEPPPLPQAENEEKQANQ